MQAPDITKTETLYVVPYAHLDTQWRWEFPQTISEYLLKTMRVNFDLIDKYPHYVFNWTGANRYRLMKEYFPNDYSRMKQYIAQGRWFPAGSSMEEGDVNLPNAEGDHPPDSLRQYLFPQRVRQGQRRVHAAGLLRIPRVAAQHPGARRHQGILHAEALGGVAARAARWRAGFARADAGGYSVQRRLVAGNGRQDDHRRAESRAGMAAQSVPISARNRRHRRRSIRTRRADAGAEGADRASRIGSSASISMAK